jgi:hypothetical protein
VRTMSNGARTRPAIPADVTAMARLAIGLGLSKIFNFPKLVGTAAAEINVGSGRLNSADNKLRVHVSIVFSNTPYTKVAFVPFQIPHAPSLVHSWDMTSETESLRRRSMRWEDACVEAGVGVAECERLGGFLRRW